MSNDREVTSRDFLNSEGKFARRSYKVVNESPTLKHLPRESNATVRTVIVLGEPQRLLVGPGDDAFSILRMLGIPLKDGEEFELRSRNGIPIHFDNAELEVVRV